jgi:hypothetical protein
MFNAMKTVVTFLRRQYQGMSSSQDMDCKFNIDPVSGTVYIRISVLIMVLGQSIILDVAL